MVKRISCAESDALRPELRVLGSCTDMDGQFHSEPQIDTVWGRSDGVEVMKDVRYPRVGFDTGVGDRLPCEHWLLDGEEK